MRGGVTPPDAPFGLGVVGLGLWGRRMAAAVLRTPGVRLAAVYARDERARTEAAADLGCRPAASLEDLVTDPAVEGVLVLTPNDWHAEVAGAAARRGRHVFVEKPMAHDLASAQQMARACADAGVTLQVGHEFRRLGAARVVAALVADGALGRVVLAESNFSLPGTFAPAGPGSRAPWRARRDSLRGGPLTQLGIHHADTLQAWLGPAVAVSGSLAHLVAEADIDDVAVAVLRHASGARSVISSSYVSPKSYSVRLYGTEGNLELRADMSVWPHADRMDLHTTVTLERGRGRQRVGFETVGFDPVDMLADELAAFARCARTGEAPETGPDEGLAALRVVLAAVASASAGGGFVPTDDPALAAVRA